MTNSPTHACHQVLKLVRLNGWRVTHNDKEALLLLLLQLHAAESIFAFFRLIRSEMFIMIKLWETIPLLGGHANYYDVTRVVSTVSRCMTSLCVGLMSVVLSILAWWNFASSTTSYY